MSFLVLIVSFGLPGAFWRAGLVAALALIAFALTRYWKSLASYPTSSRYLLIGLRGVSLILLTCALVGIWIGYERQLPARVFIHRALASSVKDESKADAETRAIEKIIASLKDSEFEFVEQADIGGANSNYPVAAIVVTDGAMTAKNAGSEIKIAQVASGGGPVFVISDFETSQSPRVVIESIEVENRPLLGVPFVVRCMVHATGMSGRASLITVSDDAQVRASARASWSGDDERQVLSLDVVPKVAGWINYSVRAEGVSTEDPDTSSRPFTIYVEERRRRILFLESEPTWEAKFIRRALDKPQLFDVDYFAQVSRDSIAGVNAGRAAAESDAVATRDRGSPVMRMRAALSSASKLDSYDCIIVGATHDSLLSNAEATRLREWVERRGGGLIILGGNSFPGSIVAPNGKLGSLLPAEISSVSFRSALHATARGVPTEAGKSRGGSSLAPTEAGQVGALSGYSNAVEGRPDVGVLSGEGFRLGLLRPGATTLAVKSQPGAQGTNREGEPLIVSMRLGSGRSIVFAPADSWRMRTSEAADQTESDSPFAALWQGMALWASSTSRSPVEIVISHASPAAGSETTAELHVRDEAYAPMTIEKLSARIHMMVESKTDASSNATSSQEIPFVPDPIDPSIWRARFNAPQPGRFDLRINYAANGKSGTADKYFATVAESPLENGASRDTLQRVARETGGDLFSASALNSLKVRLAALPQTRQTVRRTLDLRSWWPLALILPLLLSSAWFLERIKRREVVST